MSVRIMTLVWAVDLPDSEKIVLLALADCANDEGGCWPSIATIARKCSKSERTVQGCIRSLEGNGHLTRIETRGKGCNYTIHPRSHCTPAEPAPPQPLPLTPAAAAPKPSRTIKQRKGKPSSGSRPKKIDHELPDDWQPEAFGAGTQSGLIMAEWPPGELMLQLEHFRAHHTKNGTKFKNWQAAWGTWVLNSRKFGNVRSQRPSNFDPDMGKSRAANASAQARLRAVYGNRAA